MTQTIKDLGTIQTLSGKVVALTATIEASAYRLYGDVEGKSGRLDRPQDMVDGYYAKTPFAAAVRQHGGTHAAKIYIDPKSPSGPITAAERKRAEAGTLRGIRHISAEASLIANRLMEQWRCTWDQVVERLLLEHGR